MIVSVSVCSESWLEWAGRPLILKCENNGNLKSAVPDRAHWRGSQSELFDTSRQKKKKKSLLSKSSGAYGSGKLLMHFHHLGFHSGETKVFYLPTFDSWDFPHRHITDHTLHLWRHSDARVQLLFITFTMFVSRLIQQWTNKSTHKVKLNHRTDSFKDINSTVAFFWPLVTNYKAISAAGTVTFSNFSFCG